MSDIFTERAEKLKKKWATGMTNYFMRELKDILPLEQHEAVRKKLLKKFEERAENQVAKKWVEEMTGKTARS